MGIWKNLRAGAAFMRDYQQDTMETVPRWARVVRVGRRVLGTVGVDVEIHYGQTPPHVESVSVSVPRGMQLQVGQDVFVVGPKTSSDSSDTTWILDVTRPPQYGSWPTPPEFLTDAPPVAASPAAAPPGLRESRLKILQVHLRQGTITREEYERHLREMGLLRDGVADGVTAEPTISSCGGAVPDFEHGAAGRCAIGAVGHAGPTARVVPGPERPPERKVGELAFQQVHLLGVVVGDHAGTAGVQTRPPPYEPRKHSRVIGIPGQHLFLRARLVGLPPRHGVRGEELTLPFHPTYS